MPLYFYIIFQVVNRYCLTRVLKNRSRLKVTTEIRYKKSVWGIVKSMYLFKFDFKTENVWREGI